MTGEDIYRTALKQASPAARTLPRPRLAAGGRSLRWCVHALLRTHADLEDGHPKPEPTDMLAGDSQGSQTDSLIDDEVLASLPPSGEPGSLGRLDHYEILEVVGEGGMGVVLKARDTKLQRIVAIKVLAPHLAANGTARQRFIREARAGAAVRDDHVVAIYAVSDERPGPYLAMEFIGGVTLEERIRRSGPLAVKEILRIGMQTADGLAAAHGKGLIHRDVKPANILLENGVERVKITDFGLARAADDASLTQPGMIAGTPLYMSPGAGPRRDARPSQRPVQPGQRALHALHRPAGVRGGQHAGGAQARLRGDAAADSRRQPGHPGVAGGVVSKLLAKDPAERFQTAAELKGLLGGHLAELQQPRPASPPRREEACATHPLRRRRQIPKARACEVVPS